MMKKKKGRPSLSNLRKRNHQQHPQEEDEEEQPEQTLIAPTPNFNKPNRRSKPNLIGISPISDWISGDDEDDERKEKKVKLVVRLPSVSLNSASNGSDLNADGDKSQINAVGDRSADLSTADQVEMDEKAIYTLHGLPLESGPTTPLPDKKFLLFILDRLQKKDTHGVFSEPVDPEELPDYHEFIEQPMDFGTVRKKLVKGRYSNLDEFEADVFLICSNAMQYNSPNTIYFRQARSIQELAKRDFENLRQVNDDGEPQLRLVKRGRPPGKNSKKLLGSPPFVRVGPESFSDATLATVGDNAIDFNSYNLRKGPTVSLKVRSNETFLAASHQQRSNENYSEWLSELNSEFPASILKAEAKHGKKQTYVDENRRATYRDFYPSGLRHNQSALNTLNGHKKQLMTVGLHSEHGYARSLARFAANLGPVVWKIASKKIERSLPSGEKFGPGWVGENEASPQPPSALHEQKYSLPCKEDAVEASIGQDSNNESALLKKGSSEINHRFSFQTQQKQILLSNLNGFNGVSGYDLSSQMVHGKLPVPTRQSGLEEISRSVNGLSTTPLVANHVISESKLPDSSRTKYENISGVQYWQGLQSQHTQYSFPVQPDLNIGFQVPTSPNSSIRIDSPQQPDLVLQL